MKLLLVFLPNAINVLDTLALATRMRVGASVHAIALFVLNMVVSLGFCTPIHYIYINSVI